MKQAFKRPERTRVAGKGISVIMSRRSGRHLPVEALRPKFWEVAGERPEPPYLTPFHKERYLEQITDYEMADRIGMNLEDYQRMESGKARAQPHDILAFCDVVHCHPLDLYPEPWGGVPLPREIFEALLIIIREQGYEDSYMARTHERLKFEKHQAATMLEGNVGEITPLLMALGFSPDLKRWNAPFYEPVNLTNIREYDQHEYATQSLIDEDVKNPRIYMDNCLNTYELELERNAELHGKIFKDFSEKLVKNERIMRSLALQLYGPQGYGDALERLKKWMNSGDDRDVLRSRYIEHPGRLWNLTPENDSTFNMGGIHADQIVTKARLLFQSAVIYDRNQKALQSGGTEKTSLTAVHRLGEFRYWRASPRTQMMLDWFENWMILHKMDEKGNHQAPWLNIAGPFPFHPK